MEEKKQEAKKDCLFYNEELCQCAALTKTYCEIEDKPCNFYKPKESEE